ncbi:MAG: hypothetical protein CL424_08815 [Acidimicrobiaceae bacterium]|nr:hypothetical protein [Acidimicrobiaceae bacterium]
MQSGGGEDKTQRAYDERKWRLAFLALLGLLALFVAMAIAPEHFTTDSWRGPQTPTEARRWGVAGALFWIYILVRSLRYRRTHASRHEP